MKQSLALRVGQTLTMTPALQQALKLLQLSSLDLQQEIQQALESNVMLELDEDEATPPIDELIAAEAPPEPTTAASTELPLETPVDVEWQEEEYGGGVSGSTAEDEEELYEYRQANLHTGTTLREHLQWQAGLAHFNAREAEVADYLIDAINEDGYLEDWEGVRLRLRELPGVDDACIERVLRLVQDFDPPGVGARDLTECLRLQVQQLPRELPEREPALRLINEHLGLVARKDIAAIARVLETDGDVQPILALIHSLQPHPGRPYQSGDTDYIAPDVIVRKHEGRWKVSLNPDIAPKVRINPHYLGLVRRADNSRDQQTLKQHLQEARYFISSLESRNDTLLRVAQCIVEEQRAFLEYGDEAMRPLVLRDIAERLGVHESTVSRATANKYMLTPRGLYELKHFFSSHVQTLGGGTCSATAIQAMIKRMIAAEPPDRPLSDSELSELLLKDGIRVARRTVAKYREALGIPPSHERRT